MNEQLQSEIKGGYEAGLTVKEIAACVGLNDTEVRFALIKGGVAMRRSWARPFDLEKAKALYESGRSLDQVGRKLGCSGALVAFKFRVAGVPIRDRNDRPKRRRLPQAESPAKAEAKRRLMEGKKPASLSEAVALFDVSALLAFLRKNGATIERTGDNLSVWAPKGVLTSEVRTALVLNKVEILTALDAEAKPAVPAPDLSAMKSAAGKKGAAARWGKRAEAKTAPRPEPVAIDPARPEFVYGMDRREFGKLCSTLGYLRRKGIVVRDREGRYSLAAGA